MAAGKGSIGKSVFSVSGLVLVLVALVLVNLILSRINLRWDVTKDRLYSLSKGTEKILSGLEHDVKLRLFITRDDVKVPVTIKNYTDRLLEFLSEYEYTSNGKVSLEVIDTHIDSEEEEWAQKYGIKGVDLPSGERVYLGLVAESADREQAIPMLDPSGEKHLEYDITRLISMVQSAGKQKITIISGLPVFGGARTSFDPSGGAPPWLFVQELKKTYQVEEINPMAPGGKIAKDTDLVLIIHPRNLSEQLQYEIDQYLLGGGNLLILVDPDSVMDMNPGMAKGSSLERLFTAWGIRMDKTKALVDLSYATRLRGQDNQIENNPMWLSLRSEAFDKKALITSDLESMLLPVAGAIEKLPESKSKLTYEPLLRSSRQSGLVDSFKARFGVAEIRKDFTPDGKRHDIAVRLRGLFPGAFPDGPPKGKAEDGGSQSGPDSAAGQHLAKAQKEATVIVIADADFLYDGYYVQRQNFLGFQMASIFNDNLNLLLNSSELLCGADELIEIRSRGSYERPFDRVQKLEAQAQEKWLAREQELEKKVDELNVKLNAMEKQKDASQNLILSPEQEAEVKKFQEERRRISDELKQVRRNLRADIEALGARVKFVNIFLVPLLVSLGGVLYALYRRKKFHTD
ncbi:MAG: Gldg family protein [Desulfobacterales bacterium]|jgi:ABC-type uncharacterized transport system involved in gliding motility auxiliary subunit